MPAQALHLNLNLNLNLILTLNLTLSLTLLSRQHVSVGQSPPTRFGTSPDGNPEPARGAGAGARAERSRAGGDLRRPRLAGLQHPRAEPGRAEPQHRI